MHQKQRIRQLEQQNKLLKEYAKAVDGQNNARNQQRLVLEAQIERLLNLSTTEQKLIQSDQVKLRNLQAQNTRLKEQLQKLRREMELNAFNLKGMEQRYSRVGDQKESEEFRRKIKELEEKCLVRDREIRVVREQGEGLRKQKGALMDKIQAINQQRNRQTQQWNIQKSQYITKIQHYTSQITQLSSKTQQTSEHILLQKQRKLQQQSTQLLLLNQKLFNTEKMYYDLRDGQTNRQREQENWKREVLRLGNQVKSYEKQVQELRYRLKGCQHHERDQREIGELVRENQALNQCIGDLERRISVLEEVNISLRKQLKIAIESRNQETRAKFSQQDMIQTIKLMKEQIQTLRSQLIHRHSPKNQSKLHIKDIKQLRCPKCQSEHRKAEHYIEHHQVTFNDSPFRVQKTPIRTQLIDNSQIQDKFELQIQNNSSIMDKIYHETSPDFHPKHLENGIKHKSSIISRNVTHSMNRQQINRALQIQNIQQKSMVSQNTESSNKEKYEQLQRKINILKQQNTTLKRGLYGQSNY